MSHSLPNFYAIIPAPVRYCKDLPPMARLLFGEIKALANKEGYCWASNRHFEEVYATNERTIRRWLDALQKKGFIKIEIIRGRLQVSRRIWITECVKKVIPIGQKCPGEGTKKSGGEDKSVHKNNIYNKYTQSDDVSIRSRQTGEVCVTASTFLQKRNSTNVTNLQAQPEQPKTHTELKDTTSEKERLRQEIGKTLGDEEFENAYACYRETQKKQAIRNPAAWITTAARKQFTLKKDESEKIKEAAKKIEKHFANRKDIRVEALNKYLEISYPGYSKNECFFYENTSFHLWIVAVESILKKYGFPIII